MMETEAHLTAHGDDEDAAFDSADATTAASKKRPRPAAPARVRDPLVCRGVMVLSHLWGVCRSRLG